MTSLESLVPSLDLCRQLQAAGFPQDTALAWFFRADALNHYSWVSPRIEESDDDSHVAAPTAGELILWIGARLPRATICSVPCHSGWYWRVWKEGGLLDDEPLDANSKNPLVEQLAALVLRVAP